MPKITVTQTTLDRLVASALAVGQRVLTETAQEISSSAFGAGLYRIWVDNEVYKEILDRKAPNQSLDAVINQILDGERQLDTNLNNGQETHP